MQVAERLGAGVAKALLGKAVLPDDLPYRHRRGRLARHVGEQSHDARCDTLLMIGTNFPYTEFLPEVGSGARSPDRRGAEESRAALSRSRCRIVGDAADTLTRLLPLLDETRQESWRGDIEQWARDAWATAERHAHAQANPVNPQLVVWELTSVCPTTRS